MKANTLHVEYRITAIPWGQERKKGLETKVFDPVHFYLGPDPHPTTHN